MAGSIRALGGVPVGRILDRWAPPAVPSYCPRQAKSFDAKVGLPDGRRSSRRGKEGFMATMFVKHHVSHYDIWRHVYDEFAPVRKARGVEKQKVYRSIDDPNDVTVLHRFATAKAAFEFAESDEL